VQSNFAQIPLVKPKKTRLVRFNLVLAKIQLLFNNFVIIGVAERFAGLCDLISSHLFIAVFPSHLI